MHARFLLMDEGYTRRITISPFFIALLGVLLVVVVVITYLCIAVGWCSRRRTLAGPQQRRGPPAEQEETPSSLENSTVHLIPVIKYSKEGGLARGGDEGTCAVCLCEFKEGEEVRILPECTHSFHVPCIDMWLHSHPNCPLCRADTTPPQHPEQPSPDSGGFPPAEFHRLPDFGG